MGRRRETADPQATLGPVALTIRPSAIPAVAAAPGRLRGRGRRLSDARSRCVHFADFAAPRAAVIAPAVRVGHHHPMVNSQPAAQRLGHQRGLPVKPEQNEAISVILMPMSILRVRPFNNGRISVIAVGISASSRRLTIPIVCSYRQPLHQPTRVGTQKESAACPHARPKAAAVRDRPTHDDRPRPSTLS